MSPGLGPDEGLQVKLASVFFHLFEPHNSPEQKAKQILSQLKLRLSDLLGITQLL